MRKFLKILWRTVKWCFIVFFVFIGSLFFRAQRVPESVVDALIERYVPTNLVVHVDSVAVGIRHGVYLRNLRVYDRAKLDRLEPMMSARRVSILPLQAQVEIDELTYLRLPESYYAPGNSERNERADVILPEVPRFSLILNRPNILSVTPEKVVADVFSAGNRLSVERIHLDWPDRDEPMAIDGRCVVDFVQQIVEGEVKGFAKQKHIRPLIVALDVPVALPYMDGFTDVPGKVPAYCGWKVNLVNNDFDLYLDLNPTMGKYNGVAMSKASGKIHLHTYTRGSSLNYKTTVGPVVGVGPNGENLEGSVVIDGLNGTNTVTVSAQSLLPAAQLLRIGGFTGDYVDESVVGNSSCELLFTFPREETMDLAKLTGRGHLTVKDGQIMRLKGLSGLLDLMATHVPGIASFTDSTQASCDYVIEDGCIKSDNIYIEGQVFSIKIYGQHDFVNDRLDFTARVQFTKKDSLVGQVLHPLAWPFTKLLLEFKLTGSSEDPKWSYISVVDRVLEVAK